MTISVSDYIFEQVAKAGVHDVFMVSGGGIMYLCDALGRSPDLRSWCNYHEQACAIAAESYAHVSGGLGVCLVTTGPGSTNALTGVAGAWLDSIPMLVISGQVRTGLIGDYSYQRQVGPQEVNITPMAAPVTKHVVTVMDCRDIRYELEKCLYLATSGRPGPVWLNVPLDVQSATIDPATLRSFTPPSESVQPLCEADLDRVVAMLSAAQRPVLIGGNGVVLSGSRKEFALLMERLQIPTMVTISAMDLVPEDEELFQGRLGPGGQRRANFAIQNADLVLAVGTSLSISCIGFNDRFAPKAQKVLVNIDRGDLEKKNIHVDYPFLADARQFLQGLLSRFAPGQYRPSSRWLSACSQWKRDYPPMPPPELLQREAVDVYCFYDELSRQLGDTDILVSGNSLDGGTICYQTHRVKRGQSVFTNVCCGSMGWDLPALAGACVADRSRRGVLVTGDGSILFNIQELMFLGLHRLNAKIFISNNDGYQSIRNTQDRFFDGRQVGADERSGVGNPDFEKLAAAFGLNYLRIETNEQLVEGIATVLQDDEPWLCEFLVSKKQQRFRVSSYRQPDGTLASRPLEDMDPLLPREELERIMTMFGSE